MKAELSIGIFGDHVIRLPISIIPKWLRCNQSENLLMWRSFAFLISAEAKMAQVESDFEMEDDLKFLFKIAMERVYNLQPREVAA